jgi:hypothetical protein
MVSYSNVSYTFTGIALNSQKQNYKGQKIVLIFGITDYHTLIRIEKEALMLITLIRLLILLTLHVADRFIRYIGSCRWHINITITILDNNHRHVFY